MILMEPLTTVYDIQSRITPAKADLDASDHIDHFLARIGYKRSEHKVLPGLYSLGTPTKESPVFVTANYTLSFDALRSALKSHDCYILVLNTYGVNVWCAAGKGTFGTKELIERIEKTRLRNVVSHKRLILPQLGAAGVSAHEVAKRTGFTVEYGPVRAEDLPEYLKTHKATPEMRRARFNVLDRIVLIPVEIRMALLWLVLAPIAAFIIGGLTMALAVASAILAGTVLFPILLPWIPVKDFTIKGLILGILVAAPFAAYQYVNTGDGPALLQTATSAQYLLLMPPITAYLALNFTGSTPFTSRTGVRKEIYTYIPFIAGMFAIGAILLIILTLGRLGGMI